MLSFIDKILKKVLVALMAAMVIIVSWQVFSRYVLNDPSSVTEEIARFLLMWISLLGASYAYRTRMHLGLDLLVEKMPAQYQLRVNQFSIWVSVIFAAYVMVLGGMHLAEIAWELKQYSAALNISMAWVYIVMPISGALIVFYGVYFLTFPHEFIKAGQHSDEEPS